jgi:starch synthase
MAKELKILYVSGEVVPFAKTGGLADVAGALPQVITDIGNEVRIMMPKYGSINDRKFRIHDVLRLKDIKIPVGVKEELLSVKVTALPSSKVQIYFLHNAGYFGREGLYVSPSTKKDYQDNDERFTFFCRGVLETLKMLGWKPDIIHCNDWMTALIPAYLKIVYKDDPFFKNIKTVFTVHNLAYQGQFPKVSFDKTGLPESAFSPEGVEFYEQMNFMKAGLMYSDIITTVSEKYAEEIRLDEDYGAGMNGVLQYRKKDLYGILNGIDYSIWNPETDALLENHFSPANLSGKAENKKALCKRFKFEYKEDTPIIGIISRFDMQKGFDLIDEVGDKMMKLGIQLVVLGSGDKKYQDMFSTLASKYPDKIGTYFGFSDELAHLIEAGSDMFLMPSKYEPCGLNQMYSMRYGTIPVVRLTGGLADTVRPYSAKTGKGNGFGFEKFSGTDLYKTVKEAVEIYQNRKVWHRLMQSGMSENFSWENSAQKYIAIYKKLVG